MATTYEKIATTTLASANGNITFTSIGSTYTDLKLIFTGIATTGTPAIYLEINGDSGTNYSTTVLAGDGATATSTRTTSQARIATPTGITLSTTIPILLIYDVFSYAGSTNKTLLTAFSSDKNGSGSVVNMVGLWRNTAAITQLNLSTSTSTFAAGTTATLYGILKA